jgi:hypothetical protein
MLVAGLLLLFRLVGIGADDGEFLLDTTVVCFPPAFVQQTPAVTFGGENSLVVWEDQRDGNNIYAARVNRSGAVLDPQGIAVSTGAATQRTPAATFDGANYLIAWHDYRGSAPPDIYGARLDPSGCLLDTAGLAISSASGAQRYAAVASDGNGCLVVWQDYRNGDSADIYAARVDRFGNVLDPNGITITTAAGMQMYPKVSFGGGNYLVVWQDRSTGIYYDIYGARVSPAGTVFDPNGFSISSANNSQRHPAVTFDGTNYFVVWQDRRSGDSSDVYGARVSPAAVILDPEGIAISTAANTQEEPAVAFDGNNYLVTWQDRRDWDSSDVYAARVDKYGTVLDPDGIAVSAAAYTQDYVGVAFDGQNYLSVWEDGRNGSNLRVCVTPVTPGGSVVNPNGVPLLSMPSDQVAPRAAWNGDQYLVTWQDQRDGPDISGMRLTPSGIALDSIPIPIARQAVFQEAPAIAANGEDFLVVWQEESGGSHDIRGARVDRLGRVLDPGGIAISAASGNQQAPCVASDGNNWLVAWADGRAGVSLAIYAARVNRDGTVLDPAGIPVSTGNYDHRLPALGFNGREYFLVWQDWRSTHYYNIYGARIATTGVLIDTTGITVATGDYFQECPALTSVGDNWFVVWEDQRGASSDIYGARVTGEGQVLDPDGSPLGIRDHDERAPAVAPTADGYVVGWEDAGDIVGVEVNPDGRVADSFPLAAQPGIQMTPSLTAGAPGVTLLTYSGWAGLVQGKVYGAMRIWGKFPPWTAKAEEPLRYNAGPITLEAFPNPFRDRLQIRIPQSAASNLQSGIQDPESKIKIYASSGRLVRQLPLAAGGPRSAVWDATDDSGCRVPAGVYICRLDPSRTSPLAAKLVLSRW